MLSSPRFLAGLSLRHRVVLLTAVLLFLIVGVDSLISRYILWPRGIRIVELIALERLVAGSSTHLNASLSKDLELKDAPLEAVALRARQLLEDNGLKVDSSRLLQVGGSSGSPASLMDGG